MKKVLKVFPSHEEAEAADREFYKSLSSQERSDILLTLIARHQQFVAEKNGAGTGIKKVYRVIKQPTTNSNVEK